MNIVNIHSSTLRSAAGAFASAAQLGTWLRLMTFCATQENGGKIPAAASWNDRQWILATGATLSEVTDASALWRFTEAGDCEVEFYPLDQERKHKATRAGGIKGNQRRWAREKNTAAVASGIATPSHPVSESESHPVSESESHPVSESESIKERKGKKRNGMEEKEPTLDVSEDDAGQEGDSSSSPESDSHYEWPTMEEWLGAADMAGMPRVLAMREWNNQERKPPVERWAKTDRQRLRHHAAFVLDCARQRGELEQLKKNSRPPVPGESVGSAMAMEALASMQEDRKRASEYPASLVEAVKP